MIKKIPIKGISRDPSGQISSDGFCAESLNVQLDMGEVAPVIKPVPVKDAEGGNISVNGDILFIHKGIGYENLIYREGLRLLYTAIISSGAGGGVAYDSLSEGEKIKDITAIGNTIILSTSQDMYYILWRENEYHFLGNQIPIPAIHFRMSLEAERTEISERALPTAATAPNFFDGSGNFRFYMDVFTMLAATSEYGITEKHSSDIREFELYPGNFGGRAAKYETQNDMQRKWTDNIWEIIDNKAAEISDDGKCIFPVFFRYAVRLYDGTCYAQSIPILIGADLERYIKVRSGFASVPYTEEYKYCLGTVSKEADFSHAGSPWQRDVLEVLQLSVGLPAPFSVVADFSDQAHIFDGWEDIVSGVDIFVSEPIKPAKRNAVKFNIVPGYYAEDPTDNNLFVGIYDAVIDPYYMLEKPEELILLHQATYLAKSYTLDKFTELSGEVSLDDINFSSDYILSQEALKESSQSMHHTTGENLFNYNKRLILGGARQRLYHGYPFLHSVKWDDEAENDVYTFVFYIRGENGENIVVSRDSSGENTYIQARTASVVDGSSETYSEVPVSWIAYPDSRCYRAEVYKGRSRTLVASFRMKQFSQADVSYAFVGFGQELAFSAGRFSAEENDSYEMPNTLVVSKANNPFVFPAEDFVTFTAGRVMNLAVATKALSEGQFGQFPLYVFTDEGVFALSVGDDGSFKTSHPVSRDVLVSRDALAGIEQGVFFAAARGLLLLQGSSVTKVSSEMDGVPCPVDEATATMLQVKVEISVPGDTQFYKFLSGCSMVYDYISSRIVLFREDEQAQFVYKFDTQSWHRMDAGVGRFVRSLNSYPEAQVVTEKNGIQSVHNISVPAEADGAEAVPGVIYTRDLSLDAADIYKTVNRLKVRGRFRDGNVKWQLQGSNDGFNYRNLHSLRGPSWKWYRLVLAVKLEPNERISFVELDCAPKFTDKIR